MIAATPAGAEAIANGPLAEQLVVLELRWTPIRDQGAKAIAAASWPRLVVLRLDEAKISEIGAAAIAECSSLPNLRELGLPSNNPTVAAVRELAKASLLLPLHYLALGEIRGSYSAVREMFPLLREQCGAHCEIFLNGQREENKVKGRGGIRKKLYLT